MRCFVAYAILYNIAIDQNEELPPDDAGIINFMNLTKITVEPGEHQNFVNAKNKLYFTIVFVTNLKINKTFKEN